MSFVQSLSTEYYQYNTKISNIQNIENSTKIPFVTIVEGGTANQNAISLVIQTVCAIYKRTE